LFLKFTPRKVSNDTIRNAGTGSFLAFSGMGTQMQEISLKTSESDLDLYADLDPAF
jgi:hypothetical protein